MYLKLKNKIWFKKIYFFNAKMIFKFANYFILIPKFLISFLKILKCIQIEIIQKSWSKMLILSIFNTPFYVAIFGSNLKFYF